MVNCVLWEFSLSYKKRMTFRNTPMNIYFMFWKQVSGLSKVVARSDE